MAVKFTQRIRKIPLGRTIETVILQSLEKIGIAPKVGLKNGIELYIYSNEGISNKLKKEKEFEKETTEILKREIGNDDLVIDIGANIGYYAILFSKWTDNKVIAFEPEKKNFRLLKKNKRLNGSNNLNLNQQAVLDSKKEVSLEVDQENRGKTRITEEKNVQTVTAVKFDDLGYEPDFIKIDAEGSEPKIIEGMTETLEKSKPDILIEYNDLFWPNQHNAFDNLKELGYTPLAVKNDGTLFRTSFDCIPIISEDQNILLTTDISSIKTKIRK